MNDISTVVGIINSMLMMVDVIVKIYELYHGK